MAQITLSRILLPSSALILTLFAGCATPEKRTAIGAGVGAAGGAGVGAIIGGGTGALIGAGVGAVAGGVVGNQMDRQAQELKKVADAKQTADGIVVNLKNDLFFDTGSANVKPQAQQQLAQLSDILAKYPSDHIQIQGHTDNTGDAEANQLLSQNRAQAVQALLLQNGVKEDQTVTFGYGESKPVASNSTKSGQAKNRRVELFITDTEAKKKE